MPTAFRNIARDAYSEFCQPFLAIQRPIRDEPVLIVRWAYALYELCEPAKPVRAFAMLSAARFESAALEDNACARAV
eukprot:9081562-Lingulodinium_polyedra.AAC.1